jgi:hypothetical protein
MKLIYARKIGDDEVIRDYKSSFKKYSLTKLVDEYNRQAGTGIVGVRQQGLYLIAMGEEFLERFGESPIEFDGIIIGMKGIIAVENNRILYVNEISKFDLN